MTRLLTANIGSYPRIGEHKDQQRHRRGMTHFLNKDISAHAFKDVEQSVIYEAIHDQIQAGLDEVTDGLIPWQDPVSHFCSKMAGFKINGIKRYFDTNFYYHRPVITSRPKKKSLFAVDDFLYARNLAGRPVRMVLTGPLTLACHTEGVIKPYDKLAARIQFFTEALSNEISALAAKGAPLIQIDEPSLLFHPELFPALKKAMSIFSGKAKPARLILAVYFSSSLPVLDKLLALPADSLNIDVTLDGKKTFEKLLHWNPKMSIGFGCVNARNTRLEAIDPLINLLNPWLEKSQGDSCHITPSSGLEYLPRDYANAKLKLLVKIKQEIQKTSVPSDSTR